MSPFGGKLVFFLGTFHRLFLFAKLKEISSGKKFLVLNVFICESVEDLVHWCYPDILSLLFQYTCRKEIAPKKSCCKSHSYLGTFIDDQ